MRFLTITLSLILSTQAIGWENHTLVTHPMIASLPEVKEADSVKVESLDSFLLSNEQGLESFLEQQEQWMRSELWHYDPRPDDLAFVATGEARDIRDRFARAIRINPNTRWALYLQQLPEHPRQPSTITPAEISTLQDPAWIENLRLTRLHPGEMVSPVDVVSTGSDEPDHGLDIGLFTDNQTEYGKVYGFGVQPFGNASLEYGTQAPFHMGFYQEGELVYTFASFLKRTHTEYRIQLFKQLSEFAFAQGNDHWGWRFMGMGLHYIGDFSNPYHVAPIPGSGSLATVWVGLQSMLGFTQAQDEAIQLASNRHAALESFQSAVMTKAFKEGDHGHSTFMSLSKGGTVRQFEDGDIVNVFAKSGFDQAEDTYQALAKAMPYQFVDDPAIEYTDLNIDEHQLMETVRKTSGDEGYSALTAQISDLLVIFSRNAASYINGILDKESILLSAQNASEE
ncbi:hypothetical protein [Endozoicomonas ascidiicola]|uniref:hypothetical protein n=1 Tax=Endozoicomonas ascidiicola TaxID=1698521 RepID=UPI0008321305|nr:hypothetical protein [Endozoicomonas ascidiicola]